MHEFFNGCRRKAGCVALVMALAMMGMWLRSMTVFDVVNISRWEQQCQIASARGMIFSAVWHETNPSYRRNDWGQLDLSKMDDPNVAIQLAIDSWGSYDWLIPYWSITIPLTLLSAYLILWKPRKRTETEHA